MHPVTEKIGGWLARWLSKRRLTTGATPPTPVSLLREVIRPGDVLLVEGDTRVSTVIKYLTQSTWSHAAIYVGPQSGSADDPLCFVEADIVEGVRLAGFSEYRGLHTRISRPVGLTDEERAKVVNYALARLGHQYDHKNVFDLARYLFPMPPVPASWRMRMLSFGSGDPTRAICSTLIAQCFQSIRYPILPTVKKVITPGSCAEGEVCEPRVENVFRVRHHSLFVPRDFDVSPYFRIVKPTVELGFDFRQLKWEDSLVLPETPETSGTPKSGDVRRVVPPTGAPQGGSG